MKTEFILGSISLVLTFITLPAFEIIQNNAFLPFWYPFFDSHFYLSILYYFFIPFLILNLIHLKFNTPAFKKSILGTFSILAYSLFYTTVLYKYSLALNFFLILTLLGVLTLTIRDRYKEIFWVLKILSPLCIILAFYSGWGIYSNLVGKDNLRNKVSKTVPKNDIYIFLLDGTNLTSDYLNKEKYPDPKMFPNLYSIIKNDFQWFFNALSNGPQSHLSVPTMFTGQLESSKANSFLKNGNDFFTILKTNYNIFGIFRGGNNYFCRNFPDSCLGLNEDFYSFNSLDIVTQILFNNLSFGITHIEFQPESLFGLKNEKDLTIDLFNKIKKSKKGGNLFFLHTFRRNIKDLKNFDQNFGVLTKYLKASGKYEDSIIIIISDHGLDISQDFTYGTRAVQNEKIFKVPFAIKLPGKNKGQIYSYPAQGIDIAPTLLSLTIAKNDYQNLNFDGIDLFMKRPSRAFYFNMGPGKGLNRFGGRACELIPINPPWVKSLLGKISF
jgi:hypothetical protein